MSRSLGTDTIIWRSLLLALSFLLAFRDRGLGQAAGNPAIFKKQPLLELLRQNPAPQSPAFQSITFAPVPHNPVLGENSIEQQNRLILQQRGLLPGQHPRRREYEQIRHELQEDDLRDREAWRTAVQKPFLTNFQEFLRLSPDSFSVTRAIYLCESAWYDKPPTWQEFEGAVKARADQVKQIVKREGLSPKNNLALNYAIQKLYRGDNQFLNPRTKQPFTVPRLGYDFNDFMGERNWSHMFVTKLLATGKGQCHSLPLLYLALAEQLGATAYLSLSPEHSFIQFFDKNGYRYHFETTNGNLVTTAWLMQSSLVTATALKIGTYLDTLSQRRLYAQLLSDLLQNYINRLGYDEVVGQMAGTVLSTDPANVVALMTQANLNTYMARRALKEAGNPPLEKLPSYPEAYQAYLRMLHSYELIEQSGYQQMPKADYQRWLKTVEAEKKRQENLVMQRQLNKEVEKARKPNSPKASKTKH